MKTLNTIITITITTTIMYWLIKKKNNLRNLIASAIILTIMYVMLIDLSHKLTTVNIGELIQIIESIKRFGVAVNLILLSYSLIMVIINILISPIIMISTTLAGSIYLIYSSIFSKIIPILELSLSTLSNLSQLALLVFTSILDIVTISKVLLKISKIIAPTILIERVRIISIIVIITSIVLSTTSIMLLKSINIKTIQHNDTLNIFHESVKEYNNVVEKKYTMIIINSSYPSLTIIKVLCNRDNMSLTILGIGNFRSIIPCENFTLKISSIFFDLNTTNFSCFNKTINNMTIIYCEIYFNNSIYVINLGDYYVGYYTSNCSSIVVDLEDGEAYIFNPSPLNCTVNIYLPQYAIIDEALSDIYLNYISKILKFLKIYNNTIFIIQLKNFYKSISNIAYYSHTAFLLRNFSSYTIQVNNYKYVNWPINLSYVSYNEWIYHRYIETVNISKNILTSNIAHFLKDEFNRIIISFTYSILLDTLELVVLLCITINLSSIENIFYKIFIRISKAILYDFIIVLYFRIISTILARRIFKEIFLKIKSKRSIMFVESRERENLYKKIEQKLKSVKRFYFKRRKEPNIIFRKCRDIVYKSVDSRIIREIEDSRAPVFYVNTRRKRFNIIVKDIIQNLYGRDLKGLNINLKSDRRLLFLLSALYKNYDNIIDLSLDVRLTPLQVVVLSLRREILNELCKDSNEFSERLRYILDRSSNVRFIEIEFRRYVKDLYYISILLSSKIHRKVTTRMLMSINEIYHDVDRLHIFKVVRNVLDYYIDREFVAKLIDKYLKVLYKKYSDKSIIRHELRKVWYIRRLFRL